MVDVPRKVWVEVMRSVVFAAFAMTLCYGGITTSTLSYFRTYPNDSVYLKLGIVFMWCLCTATIMSYIAGTWILAVEDAGNYNTLAHVPNAFHVSNALNNILIGLCALWFIHRAYTISGRKRWVLIVGGVLGVINNATGLLETAINARTTESQRYVVVLPYAQAHFWSCVAVDLFICSVVVYFMRALQQGFNEKTDAVLGRLAKLAMESALPTTILAIGAAIAYQLRPDRPVFVPFYMTMGLVYALGLMYTLNSRAYIRLAAQEATSNSSSGRPMAQHVRSPFAVPQSQGTSSLAPPSPSMHGQGTSSYGQGTTLSQLVCRCGSELTGEPAKAPPSLRGRARDELEVRLPRRKVTEKVLDDSDDDEEKA